MSILPLSLSSRLLTLVSVGEWSLSVLYSVVSFLPGHGDKWWPHLSQRRRLCVDCGRHGGSGQAAYVQSSASRAFPLKRWNPWFQTMVRTGPWGSQQTPIWLPNGNLLPVILKIQVEKPFYLVLPCIVWVRIVEYQRNMKICLHCLTTHWWKWEKGFQGQGVKNSELPFEINWS
jgi:hypothetical protein